MKRISIARFGTCLTLAGLHTFSPVMAQSFLTYKVKKGDTLSEILGNLGVCPVWGKLNAVQNAIALNAGIVKNNGNFIRQNKIIRIPVQSLPADNEYQIQDNEVFFTVSRPQYKCTSSDVAKKNEELSGSVVGEETKVAEANTMEVKRDEEEVKRVQETNEEKKESETFGKVGVASDLFYTAMDVKDKTTGETAEILSRVNSAYQLSWTHHWDMRDQTFLFYRLENHSYESVADKMSAKSLNLKGFGGGYQRRISDRWALRFTARNQERIFIRATTVSSLALERAMISELNLAPIYQLYSRGPFHLYADFGLGYLMSSTTSHYSVKPGNKYLFGLSLTQKIKDFELLGRSYYSVENQDSSIMTKKTRELGMSFSVAWSFGK